MKSWVFTEGVLLAGVWLGCSRGNRLQALRPEHLGHKFGEKWYLRGKLPSEPFCLPPVIAMEREASLMIRAWPWVLDSFDSATF